LTEGDDDDSVGDHCTFTFINELPQKKVIQIDQLKSLRITLWESTY